MGKLIEEEYPNFESFWPKYAGAFTIGDLLTGTVHKDDIAFGVLHKNLNIEWDGAPPKLEAQQLDELKKKIFIVAGKDISEKIHDILDSYSTLEKLAAGEQPDNVTANSFAECALTFAVGALNKDKEWQKTVPPLWEKADELVKKVGGLSREKLEVKLYNLAGSYFWKSGNYPKAEEFHRKAEKIAKERGDPILLATTYNHLSVLFGDWKERPETAEEYTEAAIKVLTGETLNEQQKEESKRILGSLYNNKGIRCFKKAEEFKQAGDAAGCLKSLEEAVAAYSQSIKESKDGHVTNMIGWASFNLAEALGYIAISKYNELKDEERLSKKLKLIEKARTMAEFSKKIFTEENPSLRGSTGYTMAEGVVSMCEGDIYLAEKNNLKAVECWKDALKWQDISVNSRRQLGENRRIADGLVGRAEIYKRLERYDVLEINKTEHNKKYVADLNEACELYEKINSESNITKVKKMLGI